jgi:hypothetical protein
MSDGRKALELTCQQVEGGFCGLWVQLYDFDVTLDDRAYLDARGFSTVSFWVRGRAGGERVLLKVADEEWERREDALPIGDLSEFLPSGRLETEWQQAVVPMDRVPHRIRRDLLALFAFEVLAPGTTTFEIGPIAFSLSPESHPSLPPPSGLETSASLGHKATWIWNTAELLEAPDRATALFDFLQAEGFDHVFLQLPGNPGQPTRPGELPIDVESMRPVVAALNGRGMRVYALDGYARYALPEFHAGVLATVDHVARYNREVLPEERFYGVRYDTEPYLLAEFHGPRREVLVQGLLELTEESVRRAHAGGLVYGADIPFWYDAVAEGTNERFTVTYNGVEKPISEHLIDLVDDVSIMDYRTTAYGADGTIRHGSGELQYAEGIGKSVFVALETFPLPDEVLLDFRGEPEAGIPVSPPPGPLAVVGVQGDSIHSALVSDYATSTEAQSALATWLEANRLQPGDIRWWPISRRVEVPASKITFADQEPGQLIQVMTETAEELGRYDSFIGFAIHFAQSYRDFLGG